MSIAMRSTATPVLQLTLWSSPQSTASSFLYNTLAGGQSLCRVSQNESVSLRLRGFRIDPGTSIGLGLRSSETNLQCVESVERCRR
jgi:hypothetical protein